ncbi:MAG: hypothetical protein IPJ24_09810 [bacterium]|nr:hypothetical protein [bacterium]
MLRRLAALTLLLFVCSPGLAHAGKDPVEQFERAYAKSDWKKAGPLAIEAYQSRGITNPLGIEQLQRMAEACDYAGEHEWALDFRTSVTLNEDRMTYARAGETFSELQTNTRYAIEHNITVKWYSICKCLFAAESGDTLGAFVPYLAELPHYRGPMHGLFTKAIETYLCPAIGTAVARGDVEFLRQVLPAITEKDDMPERWRPVLVAAFEKVGDPAAAVRRAWADVFAWGNPGEPFDTRGLPHLAEKAGEVAYRNHLTKDIPPVAAGWARHLDGDDAGALADLAVAAAAPHGENATSPNHDRCLAMALAGKICEQKGDLRGALSWYHRLTWSDFDQVNSRYLGLAGVDGPSPFAYCRLHGLMGAVDQARVLLAMNRPGPAAHELTAHIDMTKDIRDEVHNRPPLFDAWADVSARLEAQMSGTAFEQPDSLGFYKDDLIVDAQGQLTPREPAARIDARVRVGHEVLQRIHADVDATARFEAEQAELEEAERALARAEAAGSAAARTQAFQFLEKVRDGRCIRCKGTGSLYVAPNVTQGWVYSEVTKERVDTTEYASGYTKVCHWCNGTGQR